jgi:periplasmic copper chaperone A
MFASLIVAISLLAAAPAFAAEPAGIEVKDAWARASAGRTQSAAAYVTLVNRGPADDKLVGASSPIAKHVHLHAEQMTQGNVMRMVAVESVDLPAGKTVTLAPSGMHLMLTELDHPLAAGGTVPLRLRFAKAGDVAIDATIGTVGAMAPPPPPADRHHH